MGIDQVGARRAVFLDRDGVLNRNVFNPATGRYESPLSPEQFELVPGAVEALSRLQEAGFLLILVSNQPNYAKGKCSLETFHAIHARLEGILSTNGITLAEAYYCLHRLGGVVPEYAIQCVCRKPLPYFLFRAQETFGISLSKSWMIGDQVTDIMCGAAAGVRTIRVTPDHPGNPCGFVPFELNADFAATDLADAAEIILSRSFHRVPDMASAPSEYPAASASE